jgi:uncharacterized protein YjdB
MRPLLPSLLGFFVLALSSCGGDATAPGSTDEPGRYVFWTRDTRILPLTGIVPASDRELGQITAATSGKPPACGTPGALTIDAPLSGSTVVQIFNLPFFGNAEFSLSPTNGCKAIEVPFVPVDLRISVVGTGSGQLVSGSHAIDCTIVDGHASSSGCVSTRTVGTKFSLVATPSAGSTFVGYGGACPGIAAGEVCTVTTVAGGTTLTVEFSAVPSLPPVATVTLTPQSGYLYVGEASAFGLTLKDAAGNVLAGRQVSWSSSTPSVANVANDGRLTALSSGTSTITATSEGKSASALLTVLTRPPEPAPVATVTLSPSAGALYVGQSGTFVVTLKDASGNVLTDRPREWSSSNSAIASVAANGLISGIAVGTATITVTSEGKSGSATVTVSTQVTAPANVATVTLAPASASLYLGDYGYFQITLRDAAGNALTNRIVTWSTSNPAVATVGSDGLVTGVGVGSTTITAASEGKTGSATLVVATRPPPQTNLCTLIAGTKILAVDGKFLGTLTNKYNIESVLNEYGTYGSPYSATSIYNKYGDYGSPYSTKSAYNAYTSSPPKIVFTNGTFLWLTVNTSFTGSSVHPDFLKTCTNFP